jgi:Tfp pilus assembly protein PilO
MMKTFDKTKVSAKHLLVDKNNNTILYAAAITVAVIIFCIVAINSLAGQIAYQNKVIGLKDQADQQLQANITAADALVTAYRQFESTEESIIGTAANNSVIVLNALPSKYDFPALAASLEALVRDSGASLNAITGIDEEAQAQQGSVDPQPIEIPFQLSATGNLMSIEALVTNLGRSIRPINIISITLSASGSQIQANISAKTYYQPEKLLDVEQYTVNKDGKINDAGSD